MKLTTKTKINITDEDIAKRLYDCFEPVFKQSTFKNNNIKNVKIHLGCLFLNITEDEYNKLRNIDNTNIFN